MKARRAVLKILGMVIDDGRSLSRALDQVLSQVEERERPLTQEMAYGVLRFYHRLQGLSQTLMDKPLKSKERDIQYLILLGMYQLLYMNIPAHAAVNETVNTLKSLKKPWARGLLNALLRRVQREQTQIQQAIEQHETWRYSHPEWLLKRLQLAWPEHWQAIAEANNQRPPMVLRVNQRQQDRASYHSLLEQAGIPASPSPYVDSALFLDKPGDVHQLPGFARGAVSVQDSAAQLAAQLLDARAGETILDACAAPGGKTAHILERNRDINLDALDVDKQRLQRVEENLQRLQLQANVICGDAAEPDDWWNGTAYDRILLDAPCSATGVIRRHPDIKLLRRDDDIDNLVALQGRILRALWAILKPGGYLLYATCSILPDENSQQVEAFLQQQDDALEVPIAARWGVACNAGRQILSGNDNMDGFYYALLQKMR